MKTKYKRKVWWNWWHLVVIVLGVILWFLVIGIIAYNGMCFDDCPQITFFEGISELLKNPTFLFYTLIGVAILYMVVTLISWMYYKNKK